MSAPSVKSNITEEERQKHLETHHHELPSSSKNPTSSLGSSLAGNNNLRSTSPSISASSMSISNASSKYQGRRYTGKLPISDIPELCELCSHFLKTQNVTGLAMIARQAGLPPHLRCKIWPILLKYHPFVQNPYIEIDIDEDEDEDYEEQDDDVEDPYDEEQENRADGVNRNGQKLKKPKKEDDYRYKIPTKEINFDLRKYLRSSERYVPKVLTPDIKDMFEIQGRIFEVIENAIIKFLRKWGSIIHYNSGLTWIALGLAEWLPPLQNSQFVLCGRDDVAKNGTKLRNINDSCFEKLNHSNLTSESSSLFDSPFSSSPASVTPLASPTNTPPTGFKQMSFAEIYERMVLVILHIPDPATIENTEDSLKLSLSKDLKQLSLLPYTGGPISDRISFFLFSMRKLLPELHSYLAEEDCLNGDWILWWLKYAGSKVWSRYDRGRTWDLILGYRTDCKKFESDLKELSELSAEQIRLLGQDLFWNPMDNVSDDIFDKNDNAVTDECDDSDCVNFQNDKHDRSLSVFTLMSKNRSPSFSIEKTPTLASLSLDSPKTPGSNNQSHKLASLDEIEPIAELPFSKVHPHVEVIFICLAFLKSKEFTITELDQSEIKTLFGRLSSLKTDSAEMSSFVSTRDENDLAHHNTLVDHNVSSNNTNGENLVKNSRTSNRDIENILIEAGELWRRFLYINLMEETDLEKV